MAGHGGGAWKVAYADFVTAMMAFFMVMWITAQSKQVKSAVAEYFKDPFSMKSKSPGGGDGPQALGPKGTKTPAKPTKGRRSGQGPSLAKTQVPDPPDNTIAKNAVYMIIHDGTKSSEGVSVPFVDDSAELSPQGERMLGELLPALTGKPNKIECRGHVSRKPLPSDSPFQDKWELCYARCRAVKQFLEDKGVEEPRLRLSLAGDSEPLTLRPGGDPQIDNSRVDVFQLEDRVEDYQGKRAERKEQNWSPGQ